jgi:hypothetical protein
MWGLMFSKSCWIRDLSWKSKWKPNCGRPRKRVSLNFVTSTSTSTFSLMDDGRTDRSSCACAAATHPSIHSSQPCHPLIPIKGLESSFLSLPLPSSSFLSLPLSFCPLSLCQQQISRTPNKPRSPILKHQSLVSKAKKKKRNQTPVNSPRSQAKKEKKVKVVDRRLKTSNPRPLEKNDHSSLQKEIIMTAAIRKRNKRPDDIDRLEPRNGTQPSIHPPKSITPKQPPSVTRQRGE